MNLSLKPHRRKLLGSGLACFLLGTAAAHAAQIGLNFSDDWSTGGGADVTEDAFGVPAARWYNLPRVFNSIAGPAVSSNAVVTLPEGGQLKVEWSCVNTYSLAADVPTGPGEDQVIYGYLDDTGVGYRVRISGLRNAVASYTVTLVASSDNAEGFTDANVAYGTGTNVVQFPEVQFPSFAGGLFAVSTASDSLPTLAGNNAVVLTGTPRNGTLRSTLAGILIDYVPGGQNPPLVEVDPAPPTAPVYTGGAIALESVASGSPVLGYQWRVGGTPIPNATAATFSKSGVTVDDSGDYDLVVSNAFGSVTSRVATVSISALAAPAITAPPLSQALYAGYPATFTVTATGGQLSYQWKKGETPIPGETNATLTLPGISANDQGTYTVMVSNVVNTASASATLTLLTPASPYAAAVAASKPLLYFRLSETGPVAQASATNQGSLGAAGTGLYVGAVTHLAPGALAGGGNPAVTLTGGRAAVGYNAALNPAGSFTVEAWANPLNVTTANRVLVQSMINGEYPDTPNDRSGWVFRQNGANLEFLIGGVDGAPFYTTTVTAQGVVTASAWNHYAAVYDADTLGVSLLVNGVEVTNVTAAAAVLPNTAAPVLIGDRGYGSWTYQGSLDEVALYAGRLTAAQLLAHYQAGTNAATAANYPAVVLANSPALYLRLDEPPLAASANAAANHGTLGAAWTGTYAGAGVQLGNPLVAKGTVGPRPADQPGFEAGNTAVGMTNGWVTSPPLVLGNNVTVFTWLKREVTSTTGDLSWPAWLGGGGLHLNFGTVGVPEAELRYHWNGDKWGWASGLFVPPDVWTFAAIVVEPAQATIYMSDGTNLLSSVNTTDHTPMVVTSPTGFGGNQPGRADRNFLGQLDEAAVYDRALTPEEVAAIFGSAFSNAPAAPSEITLSKTGGEYFLNWTSGVLQSAPAVTGTYNDVVGATTGYKMVPSGAQSYYRLRAGN